MADGYINKSKSDEWETPQAFFDKLNEEFNFDLDVCATDENHKCAYYFTINENGLLKSWGGITCGAIPLTVKYLSGLLKPSMRQETTIRLLFC